MRYNLSTDLSSLSAYLPRFLELIGPERWRKRAVQLAEDSYRSAFEAKIVSDYHWLELSLSKQMLIAEDLGSIDASEIDLRALASMYFAGSVVEVNDRLTSRGQATLKGRLLAALRAETGFASLYLEMEMAQQLLDAGYDVEFSDMEATAHFDLAFRNSSSNGEVECKSLSADAGRQIHRKAFYRFMHSIESALAARVAAGAHDVLIVTLRGRLPSDVQSQAELRLAVVSLLRGCIHTHSEGSFFTIEYAPYSKHLPQEAKSSQKAIYQACTSAFGENCHIAGALGADVGCIVVMRSLKSDDHSKPLLEAMRKAAAQLSGTCAGFVAIQFDEVAPVDLLNIDLRRRMGVLSYSLFLHYGATHVTATYFCIYGGLTAASDRIGTPSFTLLNPEPKFMFDPDDRPPFLNDIPDEEYARLLGAPQLTEGISDHPIVRSEDMDPVDDEGQEGNR